MGNPSASSFAFGTGILRRGCLAGLAIGAFVGACANSDQTLERQRLLEELNSAGTNKPAQCKPQILESCYDGPQGTSGRGLCKDGTRKCSDDAVWGQCGGQVLPAKELCNRKDDDCDGVVDNDFEREGATCTVGKGDCKTSGYWKCNADGLGTTCDAPAPVVKAEVCDGVDNDCDDKIDEDVPGTGVACQTGKPGVCAPGLMQCLGGRVQCVANVQPSQEICNNVDDDCNNVVDDKCLTADEAAKLGKK